MSEENTQIQEKIQAGWDDTEARYVEKVETDLY